MTVAISPGTYYAGNEKIMAELRQIDPKLYSIMVGSKFFSLEELKSDDIFTLKFKLLGGKGGFGSLLKSFRINKSSNQLMCRDLSGRRLADVKEEERLRKWISKKEERDQAQKRKDEEKLEKLRSGHKVKYHFKDKKYMRQRDIIVENVEDAIEAAIAAASEEPGSSKAKSLSPVENSAEATSDSDDEDIDLEGTALLLCQKSRKRKISPANEAPPIVEEKKIRTEEVIIQNEETGNKPVAVKVTVEEEIKLVEEKPVEAIVPKSYDPIDVEAVSDAKELEGYGLDHLKHELERRELKCGGSLSERAARLFSIKGLTPDKYPKKIRAVKK